MVLMVHSSVKVCDATELCVHLTANAMVNFVKFFTTIKAKKITRKAKKEKPYC